MEPVRHMGPVRALEVLSNELLFAAEGPTLAIYNYVTGEKLMERIVFQRNKIHGIEIIDKNLSGDFNDTDIKLAVWGSRSLSIFTLQEFKELSHKLPHFSVGDWIFHCLFENFTTLHVLNSHNIVYTINTDVGNTKIVESKHCNWKSILYSGTIHLNKETSKLTVLAGTVMDGILVWDLQTCEVQHNLTKHEGSIFNVISSPCGKYIISCSDDRSIKVWDMESGELLANGWGHGSRIWGLAVYSSTATGFNIFSCSEDCTARIWTFTTNNDFNAGSLIQDRIVLGHTGRHVWSIAVNDEKKIGFTGGADGKILVTDLDESSRPGYWGQKWELEDIATESGHVFKKGELFKSYVDFGHGLVAVTSEGEVMVLKHYKKWMSLFQDSRFERSCILKEYQDCPVVMLGNKLGDVIVMKFDGESEMVLKKEFNVRSSFPRLGNILLHEHDGKHFALFESPNPKDDLIYNEINIGELEIVSSVQLSKPNDKISISSVEYNATRDYLLVGCRFATMLVYKVDSEHNYPIAVYRSLFRGDTVSCMKSLDSDTDCLLYLTNKDGTYHIMKINSDLGYEFIQSSRIQKGFLEGIIKLPDGDIILYGFKSDSFFVWNETKQYEILREICGGPHRRWFFKHWIDPASKRLRYRFTYTRASEVQVVQCGESYAVDVLTPGLHGREIRDICVVNTRNGKDEKIVITGSEDTTLKISTLKANGQMTVHWTYREHVAGLQSIHAINDEFVLSSSAKEELFLWKISECDGKQCLTLHGCLPPSDENPDLRIMDFDTMEVFRGDCGEPSGFLLVTVYSNSVIKVIYYDYKEAKFTVIVDDSYMMCCIFQTKIVCLNDKLYVMIGSTNGHLTMYDLGEVTKNYFAVSQNHSLLAIIKTEGFPLPKEPVKFGKIIFNQQIHQSSIKGMDLIQTDKGSVKVITGGDDNALVVSKVEDHELTGLSIDIESFDPSAASSTITTVSAINDSQVLVGAVDQSIKIWDIASDLEVVEEKYTTVADTGCSEVVKFENGAEYALLGGAGFSLWKITE